MEQIINQSSLRRILKEEESKIGARTIKELESKYRDILDAAIRLSRLNKRTVILKRDIL